MSEREYTLKSIEALKNQGEATRELLNELLENIDDEEYSEEFIIALIKQMRKDWVSETEAAENGVQRGQVEQHRKNADSIIDKCKSEKFRDLTGLDSDAFIKELRKEVMLDA